MSLLQSKSELLIVWGGGMEDFSENNDVKVKTFYFYSVNFS